MQPSEVKRVFQTSRHAVNRRARQYAPRLNADCTGVEPIAAGQGDTTLEVFAKHWTRVLARTPAQSGTHDDAGRRRGPVTRQIEPGRSIHFTSLDMEHGNAAKGFPGWGPPTGARGHWRLELKSDVPLDVRAYLRSPDGFSTSLAQPSQAIGEETDNRVHLVPFVNPARNVKRRSLLRLTNQGARATTVTLELWHDAGKGPERAQFDVGAGRTRQVSAADIEAQVAEGTGKWKGYAAAEPAVPLTVMSILDSVSGHVGNMSR